MKGVKSIKHHNAVRGIPIVLAACLAGTYTAPAHATAIYDAVVNADVSFSSLFGPASITLFPNAVIPITNDPDGPGPSTADAGGIYFVTGANSFSAHAYANGTAAPNPAPASSDSLASVTGTIFNPSNSFLDVTATIMGDFLIGASVGDPLAGETANAGVMMSFSSYGVHHSVTSPDFGLGLTRVVDEQLINQVITLPALSSIVFTFELRAYGDAFGVTPANPQPINVDPVPVPEPGMVALLAIGLAGVGFVAGRRRDRSQPRRAAA